MIQFFAPDIATNPILPESDSQHCIRVLRMKEGDTLVIDYLKQENVSVLKEIQNACAIYPEIQ